MKNFLLIIILLSGFAVSALNAQSCHPCPPCPACPQGCCIYSGSKASSASAQIMPSTLDLTGKCAAQSMTACQYGKKMSRKEMKACQASCTSGYMPASQPSTAKTTQTSEAAVDEKFHQSPAPQIH